MATKKSAPQQAVWRVIRKINAAWVGGQPEAIAAYFHENIIIVAPNGKDRVHGRQACVQTYIDFCAQAQILDFAESDESIDIIGSTAMVMYAFDIAYEMNGQRLHEKGQDLFILQHNGTNWQAIWRYLLPTKA